MVVVDVVLDVGVAIVFVNHLVSLGKTGLELIILLGRIQLGVMFGLLQTHQLIAIIVINGNRWKFVFDHLVGFSLDLNRLKNCQIDWIMAKKFPIDFQSTRLFC